MRSAALHLAIIALLLISLKAATIDIASSTTNTLTVPTTSTVQSTSSAIPDSLSGFNDAAATPASVPSM